MNVMIKKRNVYMYIYVHLKSIVDLGYRNSFTKSSAIPLFCIPPPLQSSNIFFSFLFLF